LKLIFIFLIAILYSSFLLAESPPTQSPYIVLIPAGSILTAVNTGKKIVTDHDMKVYTLEESETERTVFGVYNNKMKKKYLTSALNIKDLDPDISLLPNMNVVTGKKKSNVFKSKDDEMQFESSFYLHVEQLSLSEFNTIYTSQNSNAKSTRFEFRTMYNTLASIRFGLNLNFQNIYWPNGNEQLRLSILSIGPNFSYQILKTSGPSLFFLVGAEIAPFAQNKSKLNVENYYAYAYDLGVEAEFPTDIGIIVLGSHYRNHLLLLKDSTRAIVGIYQKEYDLSSLGISLGLKVDWEL
jgi:hypothetical protein